MTPPFFRKRAASRRFFQSLKTGNLLRHAVSLARNPGYSVEMLQIGAVDASLDDGGLYLELLSWLTNEPIVYYQE
jgi:hypothetical protein